MLLTDAEEKFINAWGTLGSNWGISRTLAMTHALLLITPDLMNTDQVMEKLQISRGNANANLRELMDWGLIRKEIKTGDRKEYFFAEKDIYKVFRLVVKERRKRELEPIFQVLEEVTDIDSQEKKDRPEETKYFLQTIKNIQDFTNKADKVTKTIIKTDESWFLNSMIKLFGK
jgi:DNA-binding transcriptional regulator GbsR (MarR family)